MSKTKLALDVVQDLRTLADSVEALANAMTGSAEAGGVPAGITSTSTTPLPMSETPPVGETSPAEPNKYLQDGTLTSGESGYDTGIASYSNKNTSTAYYNASNSANRNTAQNRTSTVYWSSSLMVNQVESGRFDLENTLSVSYRNYSVLSSLRGKYFSTANAHPNMVYFTHGQDMVWIFGKMYRRSFLTENGVRFHPTSRANEDNGYNTIIRLIADPQHQVGFLPDIVYYWHTTEGSITRTNNCQYSFDGSFTGYAENMAYAVETARKLRPFNGQISLWAAEVMCHLYEYYTETVERAPQFAAQNWAACQRYYDSIFRQMRPALEKNVIAEVYSHVMACAADKLVGIAPEMTIWQFLDKLEGSERYEAA